MIMAKACKLSLRSIRQAAVDGIRKNLPKGFSLGLCPVLKEKQI
jgi:hypothetical protein